MDNDLIVLVKKYFDKVNGNTYHSVQFKYNSEVYHSGKRYGYGIMYEQTFDRMRMKYTENLKMSDVEYIVIENCKAKELKEIHEYK